MDRRRFLQTVGTGVTLGAAGCVDSIGNDGDGSGDGEDGDRTLVVGTYGAFVDAPSTSPGAWIKEQFESEFDARLEWQAPDNELNYYVERRNSDVEIEADMYVGLNVDDLVRIDDAVDGELFAEAGDVEGRSSVRSELEFDPRDRAVPYDTGYVSLVYDGTETDAPHGFEGLLEHEHQGDLIAQNPASSTTGRAFLLHTVDRFGEEGYLDFWASLQENDVRVLNSWSDAYNAWSQGEAPMVVSYSTDQVFAAGEGEDLEEHQIRFLDDQAYANPEGMALFADAGSPDLAREFMGFVLRPDVQGEIAERNVQFPATDDAELPEDYAELAQEPPEPVTFTYEELQGNVEGWIEDWERQFAGN